MTSQLDVVIHHAIGGELRHQQSLRRTIHSRWLGKVPYQDALALQSALFERSSDDYLLLLEHPHVFTMGVRAKVENLLDIPSDVDVINTNRGGDVTYHGPGQLVGYPILNVGGRGGLTDTAKYVCAVEQLIIDVLADLGISGASRMRGEPGVWLDVDSENARKIAAVGVRITRGRTMHGFALNVNTDMSWFDRIVPCGISDKEVTSIKSEGIEVSMQQVVEAVLARAGQLLPGDVELERQDVAWRVANNDLSAFTRGEGPGQIIKPQNPNETAKKAPTSQPVRLLGRLAQAGVDSSQSLPADERKPDWMKVRANFGPEYTRLKNTMRSLDLVTVCEEAGCPNIFDCWNDGTATFMINGERCTRACGFCLVDTRKPLALDPQEPQRVADAVEQMKLQHVVITVVARDDLADGGAGAIAETVRIVHDRCPGTAVEVLISDCKGDGASLQTIFDSRPEVLNHNLETVARLQRAVRPSAGYARSLSVLSRAKDNGLVTKSGLIVGMGETRDEIISAMRDLRGVGVDIVTIGQYLRPTSNHLPIARWWTPEEFAELKVIGEAMGFAHVESSPLTRSSYHAKAGAQAATNGSFA